MFFFFSAQCLPDNETRTTGNYTTFDEIFLRETRFYIQRVLTPIIVVIGIFGNLVTIVVLSQRRMKSSTNVYLRALAVSDSLYLIFSFALSLRHYHELFDIDDFSKYPYYWRLVPFLFWCIDASSEYISSANTRVHRIDRIRSDRI